MSDSLIAIFTCKRYTHRVQAQLDTWIPEVRAAGFDVEIFDGDRLGTPDGYEACVIKARALYQWTLDHGYKRIMKCDDDIYINSRNLRPVDQWYAGIRIQANYGGDPRPPEGTIQFDYASGAAFWLGIPSLQILSKASSRLSDNSPFEETCFSDRWEGQVLGRAGIFVTALPNYHIVGEAWTDNMIALTQLTPDQIHHTHGWFHGGRS